MRLVPDAHVTATVHRIRTCADMLLGVVWYAREAREGWPGIPLGAAGASLAARAACLGPVPGRVAAAIFASMEPTRVERSIDAAWSVTTPQTLLDVRLAASTRELRSMVGEEPPGIERAVELLRDAVHELPGAGHPLYAGLRGLPRPGAPLGDLWRACDMLREHRSDSLVHAWTALGIDPVEINVLSELSLGTPLGSVARMQMGWSQDDVDDALDRLRTRGYVRGDTHDLTGRGRQLRDDIELATDLQEQPLVDALGDQDVELLELLDPWARAVATATTSIDG